MMEENKNSHHNQEKQRFWDFQRDASNWGLDPTPTNKLGLRFHHIGIACADLEKVKSFIKKTLKVKEESATVFDENQNAHICILTLDDGTRLELIRGEMVRDIVAKGITYYHTCYTISDINSVLQYFRNELQAIVISEPKPAKIFNGRLAAFLYTPLGVLELLEE